MFSELDWVGEKLREKQLGSISSVPILYFAGGYLLNFPTILYQFC